MVGSITIPSAEVTTFFFFFASKFSFPGRSHVCSILNSGEEERLAHDVINTAATCASLDHDVKNNRLADTEWLRSRYVFSRL